VLVGVGATVGTVVGVAVPVGVAAGRGVAVAVGTRATARVGGGGALAAAVSGKATRLLGVWQGSAAEQAQEMVPDGVHVVSAFHTVSAALLTDLDQSLHEDVLLCGDHRADKTQVAELLGQIEGLRAVDCGPLEMARIVEGLTPLIISINVRHKVRAGIKITGL